MKNVKRILSIKTKKMVDDSPDTSWLGEYSDNKESEFSIDRAHSEDCASIESNHKETVDALERVITHLDGWRIEAGRIDQNDEWFSLDQAIDLCIARQDDAMECDCNGPHVSSREYRYFNGPIENYKGESDADIRKYVRQDFERMESLNAGNWCFVGIRLDAEILIGAHCQTITFGGLWGIESDSDASYIAEVIADETSELKAQLKALGFSARAISAAFKNVEEVSE